MKADQWLPGDVKGDNGYVHFLDYGDNFTIYTYVKTTKLYALLSVLFYYVNYISKKLLEMISAIMFKVSGNINLD